ncbi:MAG: hypothetical protein ACI802_002616 [Candidatus Paceibacteria bacterium]
MVWVEIASRTLSLAAKFVSPINYIFCCHLQWLISTIAKSWQIRNYGEVDKPEVLREETGNYQRELVTYCCFHPEPVRTVCADQYQTTFISMDNKPNRIPRHITPFAPNPRDNRTSAAPPRLAAARPAAAPIGANVGAVRHVRREELTESMRVDQMKKELED